MLFDAIKWYAFEKRLPRAAYHFVVRHAYDLGGYDLLPGQSLDITESGLEWVRTFNLRHRNLRHEYRLINFDDARDVLGVAKHPTEDEVL